MWLGLWLGESVERYGIEQFCGINQNVCFEVVRQIVLVLCNLVPEGRSCFVDGNWVIILKDGVWEEEMER